MSTNYLDYRFPSTTAKRINSMPSDLAVDAARRLAELDWWMAYAFITATQELNDGRRGGPRKRLSRALAEALSQALDAERERRSEVKAAEAGRRDAERRWPRGISR